MTVWGKDEVKSEPTGPFGRLWNSSSCRSSKSTSLRLVLGLEPFCDGYVDVGG